MGQSDNPTHTANSTLQNVLVVSDDSDRALALCKRLKFSSISFEVAHNIDDTQSLLSTGHRFDAALVDLVLPDSYAGHVVTLLRNSPSPVASLLVCSEAPAIATGIALACDAHDILFAPFDDHSLFDALVRTGAFTAELSEFASVDNYDEVDYEINYEAVSVNLSGKPDVASYQPVDTPGSAPAQITENWNQFSETAEFVQRCREFVIHLDFTPAQSKVFPALLSYYDDKDVARLLGTTEWAVRCHIQDIIRKFEGESRQDVLRSFLSTFSTSSSGELSYRPTKGQKSGSATPSSWYH